MSDLRCVGCLWQASARVRQRPARMKAHTSSRSVRRQTSTRAPETCGAWLAQGGGCGARLGARGEVSLEVGFMIGLIVLISCASVVFLYPLTYQKSTLLIFAR